MIGLDVHNYQIHVCIFFFPLAYVTLIYLPKVEIRSIYFQFSFTTLRDHQNVL